ncbi:MAG: hypothetical protein AB4368_13800 [Xenococcaceae cyanobacterium]
MLAVELKRPKKTRATTSIAFRLKNSDLESIQKVVDELFDGNISLLMRTALDEYMSNIQETIS